MKDMVTKCGLQAIVFAVVAILGMAVVVTKKVRA